MIPEKYALKTSGSDEIVFEQFCQFRTKKVWVLGLTSAIVDTFCTRLTVDCLSTHQNIVGSNPTGNMYLVLLYIFSILVYLWF